jgi:hypothetical protein
MFCATHKMAELRQSVSAAINAKRSYLAMTPPLPHTPATPNHMVGHPTS